MTVLLVLLHTESTCPTCGEEMRFCRCVKATS